MNLCDIQEIKALLTRHGFHFSKSKGQNFLTAAWVPRELAEASGAGPGCGVLEVGPGIGCLTEQLSLRAEKVVAVELDQSLRPILAETMAGRDNLTIRFGDILRLNLAELVREEFPGLRVMACANLPYYITSPVVSALLESRCFESVTVMVQSEVADRVCAPAGTPEYSAFTVLCGYYAVPETLSEVPASCFVPQPKVTSAILRLTARSEPPCGITDEKLFFRVVRASFGQRRKTLLNALSSAFGELGKEQLAGVIASCGLPPAVRGEVLDMAGFAAVSAALRELLDAGGAKARG